MHRRLLIFCCATLMGFSPVAFSQEMFGMYPDSEWNVSVSHSGSGYGQGQCVQSFTFAIPKGGGEIPELLVELSFIDETGKVRYSGKLRAGLRGSSAGWQAVASLTDAALCFEIKEVVVTKAIAKVDGKARDLIKEKKIVEAYWKPPTPIKIGKPGS